MKVSPERHRDLLVKLARSEVRMAKDLGEPVNPRAAEIVAEADREERERKAG